MNKIKLVLCQRLNFGLRSMQVQSTAGQASSGTQTFSLDRALGSKTEPNALASGYLEAIASDKAPEASAGDSVRVVTKVLRQSLALAILGWALVVPSLGRAQHLDVLPQVVDGKIAIGAADYDNNTWTIGHRVFQRQLLSNFRANDPGFTGLATGNPLLESGVTGFPANHDVYFDLLPMRIESVKSNLFFWDGTDLGGNGLGVDDVQFVVPPAGVTWNIFDDGFNLFTAAATDAFVPGGLLQQTSSDTNPGDGIDTGTIHTHLLMRVDDGDGNTQTTPPQGVYMAALQVRAAGFETSDPFLFVHRTSSVSNEIRDLAAEWADLNYDSLFGLPGDFDQDGDVDGRDFLAWQRGESPSPWGPDDLAEWQSSFGTGPLLANFAGVPEPTSLSLAGGSLLLGWPWRSRWRRNKAAQGLLSP